MPVPHYASARCGAFNVGDGGDSPAKAQIEGSLPALFAPPLTKEAR
jgi:hypothetical protein